MRRLTLVLCLALSCSLEPVPDREAGDGTPGMVSAALNVGGYACVSGGTCAQLTFADLPDDDTYDLTTFTGEGMSCGGNADSTWAYIAGRARWGCGTLVVVRNPADGTQCVAEVADCGPNRCVEQAAGRPVVDASPLVSRHLFGQSSAGWSEHLEVTAQVAPAGSESGCPGVVGATGTDPGAEPTPDVADAPRDTAGEGGGAAAAGCTASGHASPLGLLALLAVPYTRFARRRRT